MRPQLHLFGKIFVGFWLTTIAVLASWMLASHYFDTRPEGEALRQRPHDPPQRFVLRLMYELQNAEESALETLIKTAKSEHDVDIYLLNGAGADLLGRVVPANAEHIAQELRGKRRRAYQRVGRELLLAHALYRPDSGRLRAIFIFQPPRHPYLAMLGSNIWLRIGLAVAASGLVCFGLSRLLTRRIGELRTASRRLATGELETRLRVRQRGGDETDELARDFNTMAQQLQERVEAQKRLLVDVSHELRSPLARLRIAVALGQENAGKAADYLQRIERETERLEDLIGQLLSSQATVPELDTHIDLVSLLQHLCDDANFEGAKQSKRVTLDSSITEAIVASSGDLLHKSFDNILRNALSHAPPDSIVTVALERTGNQYRVTVTDQGDGVAEDELEKIFDAFYRTDAARSHATGGHGLGLAIARRGIQQHGGQIAAANTGRGLAVTINLPIQLNVT